MSNMGISRYMHQDMPVPRADVDGYSITPGTPGMPTIRVNKLTKKATITWDGATHEVRLRDLDELASCMMAAFKMARVDYRGPNWLQLAVLGERVRIGGMV